MSLGLFKYIISRHWKYGELIGISLAVGAISFANLLLGLKVHVYFKVIIMRLY